ncbi:MAG: L,D-transpeptidase family protein [Candidatus Pacebacteria bacterium]|nr:L,D-transpeptidase family protein [Candidatus Paceibacterota bacterium]
MFSRFGTFSFDWKGFAFAAKGLIILGLIGVGGYYALSAVGMPTGIKVSTLLPKPSPIVASAISTTTPKRIINSLTIQDAIPTEGKLIAADLVEMKVFLYEDGELVKEFPIQSKGRTGSAWETPSGMYAVQTKEVSHFSSIGHVYMPWSMQFYGNYFIHGWTTYPDGTPVSASFSGGCIKLLSEDAEQIFNFAEIGTKVFVYDTKTDTTLKTLAVDHSTLPPINAHAYLVADVDTGDVYAERNANVLRPIASVTKLMTALVANETISFDRKVTVAEGSLVNPPDPEKTDRKTFVAEDLVYPLLMQSSNGVADSLSSYYGKNSFVNWMNTTAKAFGMHSTTFADASGISAGNISTADDLFRLATYLANKKSFVFNVTHMDKKTIMSDDGVPYTISNVNAPAAQEPYVGGKVGHTLAAKDTMVSLLAFNAGDQVRRVAVIVLGSDNQQTDTSALTAWITQTSAPTLQKTTPACIGCLDEQDHRKIEI